MLCIGLKSFHPTDYTVLYLQIANQNYLETDVNVGENVHLVLYYNPVGFLKRLKKSSSFFISVESRLLSEKRKIPHFPFLEFRLFSEKQKIFPSFFIRNLEYLLVLQCSG